MSRSWSIVLILGFLIPLWFQLKRDYFRGLCYAVFLFVSMTTYLRIETSGMLPELTLHRLMLWSVLVFWLRLGPERRSVWDVPIIKPLIFLLSVYLISLLGSENKPYSFKRCLDLLFERSLFLVIVVTSVRTQEDALRIVRALLGGLAVVAFFGLVEHSTGYNWVDRYFPPEESEEVGMGGVHVTYPHRILFGAAMAMGWPIAVGWLAWRTRTTWGRWVGWSCIGMMLSTCYFSMSRGPWMASAVGFVAIYLLGSSKLRKGLNILALAALVVLLNRPGVLLTLTGYAKDTVDADTQKGGSFQWRLELWKVAWTQVSQSGWRFLFGYGPAAGHGMELYWEGFRGRSFVITSWDNQVAYTLYEVGVVGFLAMVWLYGRLVKLLLRIWRESPSPERDSFVCLFASMLVFLFMMTNVLIFARQLEYLFWSLSAAGFALGDHFRERVMSEDSAGAKPLEAVKAPDFLPTL